MRVKKNIVFILPNLNSGGAEKASINYLRQLDLDEYTVTLIVFNKTDRLLPLLPERLKVIDLRTGNTSRSIFSLLKSLRELSPDVVFTTHSRIAALLLVVKPFLPRFRHLARMQSTPSLEAKHGVYGGFVRYLYSLGFRNADVVIAQTESMKDDGVATFRLKPNRVKVMSNPIDKLLIDKSVKESTPPFSDSDSETVAVASGRLAYEKGFDLLICALPVVLVEVPSLVLHIIGSDNGEGRKLKALVGSLGLADHVRFHGFKSNPYCYYAYCDLFILSSRWEGFPNTLLENYYLNTPLVSTTCVPIVAELIEEGVNGYLCAPGDVDMLAEQIIKGCKLKRHKINNHAYEGSMLEDLL